MAVGDVSVRVVPDATNFWRDFRSRTAGQANAEGRRAGEAFRRGMQETAGRSTVHVRADVDTARARAELASLERQGNQSGGGLLKALLPLAPALFPLAGAALAAGSGLAVLGGAGILAVTGLNRELKSSSQLGGEAAASVSVVKDALHSLQSTAARAALPGLQASVVAINAELPALRRTVSEQATIAGQVAAHLVRGIAAGFTTFQPIISAVGADVDNLAAHFEAFSSGPGGARFAKTLATDYANVKPVLESVTRAVADIARAASSSGLGILHILGDIANVIDSFPTPVLTAIVDGFLAFRAIGAAATAVRAVTAAFAATPAALAGARGAITGYGQAVQNLALIRQRSALQGTAAEARAAAQTSAILAAERESRLASAEAAQQARLEIVLAADGVTAAERAALEEQIVIADAQIARYADLAAAARASAVAQAAASETATAAAAGTGIGALARNFGKVLGPIALAAAAIPLLSGLFGDNGQQAQAAASQIDSYSAALVSSKGALDDTIRAQVAKNLADEGAFTLLRGSTISQQQLTDAVLSGGDALKGTIGQVDAYLHSQGVADVVITAFNNSLRGQNKLFEQGAQKASDLRAAVDTSTASQRAHAAALGTDVASYVAATDAAAKSIDKTREQTVAFQLENDAASLLSQALKSLAGQNLDVATAQTSFNQSTNSAIAALTKNKNAILGHSDAALTDQQAIQGSVSAARQYADAVAKQTGSSDKAAAAYRSSRDALLSQLRAQGLLTPAVRKYINSLFDVKGVSDYLRKHPTVHDVALRVKKAAADAQIHKFRNDINAIRQNRVPGLNANTRAGREAIAALRRAINDVRQGKKPKIDLDIANALRKKIDAQLAIDNLKQQHRPDVDADISYLQRQVDAANAALNSLHDRTISVTTTFLTTGTVPGAMYGTPVYADPGRRHATGGPVHGPGSGTSDSIPAWLSNGEYVVNAKATAKHRHLLDSINKGVRGFAGGGPVGTAPVANAAAGGSGNLRGTVLSAVNALASVATQAQSSAASLSSAGSQFLNAAKAAKLTSAQYRALAVDNASLAGMGRLRERIAARLGSAPTPPTAYDQLATAQQNYAGTRSTVQSAFAGTFNIANVQTQYGEPVSLRGIMRAVRDAAKNAKQFDSALHRLDREGLSPSLLDQLAEAGPSALPEALALLQARPKQLAALNRQSGSLAHFGGRAGTLAANDMYGAGVRSAQGLVNGLLSQEHSLNGTIKHLADGMIATLRRELDMHSPSRRLFREGALAFEGYRQGVESMQKPVAKAVGGVAGVSMPGRGTDMHSGGHPVHIENLHLHYPTPDTIDRGLATAIRATTNGLGR